MWAIQLASPTVGSVSRPAVFSRFASFEADDDPVATLVVQGNTNECTTIRHWLPVGSRGGFDWARFLAQPTTRMAPALESLLAADCSPNERGLRRFRDRQVLYGLLAGACVLRSTRQEVQPESPLVVDLEDYELVRDLLQSPLVASVDDSFDPLAAAMVSRVNVYMTLRFGTACEEARDPFGTNGFASQADGPDGRSGREPITRREVADLGNVRSRVVRGMVAAVQRHPNGYELFRRLGLIRRPPSRDVWPRTSAGALADFLRTWSAKQVRTHFDRLSRTGFITAERERANGPWRYELPDEIQGRDSAFRDLPSARELPAAAPG